MIGAVAPERPRVFCHDRPGSYAAAFWLAISLMLVSMGAVWLAAPRKVRAVAGRLPRPREGVER